jgi:hypothetical protein
MPACPSATCPTTLHQQHTEQDGLPRLTLFTACCVVLQASAEYSTALHELGAAEAALSHMAAGFQLEEAASRRSSAAPPSPLLMAGERSHSGVMHAVASPVPSQRHWCTAAVVCLCRHLRLAAG